MRVLLDTCVLFELMRPKGEERVRERIAALPPSETYLSVVTIRELARGIALLPTGRKRDGFAASLMQLERDYGNRILPVDTETGHLWGEIDAKRQQAGRRLSVADGLIAATAKRHGLHVVTRNVRYFEDTGVLIVDPWKGD